MWLMTTHLGSHLKSASDDRIEHTSCSVTSLATLLIYLLAGTAMGLLALARECLPHHWPVHSWELPWSA